MSVSPIRALVAIDRVMDPSTIEAVLDDPGINVVDIVEQEAGVPNGHSAPADVLVIACGAASETAVEFVAQAARERTGQPLVVACGGHANGFVRDVLTSGADDIVLIDSAVAPGPEMFFALQKALARRSSASVEHDRGSLVCVLGPKGG